MDDETAIDDDGSKRKETTNAFASEMVGYADGVWICIYIDDACDGCWMTLERQTYYYDF